MKATAGCGLPYLNELAGARRAQCAEVLPVSAEHDALLTCKQSEHRVGSGMCRCSGLCESKTGREGGRERQRLRERERERERENPAPHTLPLSRPLHLALRSPFPFQGCDPGRRLQSHCRGHAHLQQLVGLLQPSARASFMGLSQIYIC